MEIIIRQETKVLNIIVLLVNNVAKFKSQLYLFFMKYFILLLAIGFFPFISSGQSKINRHLKRQLDSVMVLDQKYRDTLTLLMNPKKRDSMAKRLSMTVSRANAYYWTKQDIADSLNVLFVEGVFKKYGYPGKTVVDTPTNEAAWYVIQHSHKIDQYMPLMKAAAEKGELPFRLYAMMLDRQLMNQNKEQIYGTQISCRKFKNIKDECIVWPIKDPANVNQRRKAAGLPLTVEQNAARLGVVYRVIAIDEVQ